MTVTEQRFDVVADLRERGAALAGRLAEFLDRSAADLRRASQLLVAGLEGGATVFTCGNGGSAAHAAHLEAELVGRYRADRRPLPCVCLGLGASSSTALVNDYGAEEAFARPLEALAKPGDVLVAFSTSGASPNVLRALDAARGLGVASILVSGPGAGPRADVVLRFPGPGADAIQDGHDLVLHALMDAVEAALVAAPEGAESPVA